MHGHKDECEDADALVSEDEVEMTILEDIPDSTLLAAKQGDLHQNFGQVSTRKEFMKINDTIPACIASGVEHLAAANCLQLIDGSHKQFMWLGTPSPLIVGFICASPPPLSPHDCLDTQLWNIAKRSGCCCI